MGFHRARSLYAIKVRAEELGVALPERAFWDEPDDAHAKEPEAAPAAESPTTRRTGGECVASQTPAPGRKSKLTEKEGKERKETHRPPRSSMLMDRRHFRRAASSAAADEARLFLCINDAAGAGAAPEERRPRDCRYFPNAA